MSTIEERVSALEQKLQAEIDRLYNVEFPAYDTQLENHHLRIEAVREENHKASNEVLDRMRSTEARVTAELGKTIEKLVAESNSTVVTAGLVEALKRIVVKTRPATREETRTGEGVVAVRQATTAELRTAQS
jgi:hypothetical protein